VYAYDHLSTHLETLISPPVGMTHTTFDHLANLYFAFLIADSLNVDYFQSVHQPFIFTKPSNIEAFAVTHYILHFRKYTYVGA